MQATLHFRTLAEVRQHCDDNDCDGVYIVEGKGDASRPWALLDAGIAEDLLSDDLGRVAAASLLRDLDRRGQYIVRLAEYTEVRHA